MAQVFVPLPEDGLEDDEFEEIKSPRSPVRVVVKRTFMEVQEEDASEMFEFSKTASDSKIKYSGPYASEVSGSLRYRMQSNESKDEDDAFDETDISFTKTSSNIRGISKTSKTDSMSMTASNSDRSRSLMSVVTDYSPKGLMESHRPSFFMGDNDAIKEQVQERSTAASYTVQDKRRLTTDSGVSSTSGGSLMPMPDMESRSRMISNGSVPEVPACQSMPGSYAKDPNMATNQLPMYYGSQHEFTKAAPVPAGERVPPHFNMPMPGMPPSLYGNAPFPPVGRAYINMAAPHQAGYNQFNVGGVGQHNAVAPVGNSILSTSVNNGRIACPGTLPARMDKAPQPMCPPPPFPPTLGIACFAQREQPAVPAPIEEQEPTDNEADFIPSDKTTIMLRNLPEGFVRDMVTDILREEGFATRVDFVYVPMNFRNRASFGYAFVNLVSPEAAEDCRQAFEGFRRWPFPSDKVCEVSWSDMHQGFEAHVERYRNSPLMHETVLDEFKPAIFEDGVRVAFPPPTKPLRPPRLRRSTEAGVVETEDSGSSPARSVGTNGSARSR